jgi:outer membrane protein assembly factor BamB
MTFALVDTLAPPADTRQLALTREAFLSGQPADLRFQLINDGEAVLHVRLAPGAAWIVATPSEVALAAGERQTVCVAVDTVQARRAALTGEISAAPLALTCQLLAGTGGTAPGAYASAIFIRLPLAQCPTCEKVLDADLADGITLPDVCPACYERLRACPACGAARSWRDRTCERCGAIVRASPDWGTLGGGPGHTGFRPERAGTALARRWSSPSVAPARRESLVEWSAPAAAYGLVASTTTSPDGTAHVVAYDLQSGAPLWEPLPLRDPLYAERGGVCIADGRLAVATVEGLCLCLDALRGTRLWQTTLPGQVYGAMTATDDGAVLLVALRQGERGLLRALDAATGETRFDVPLPGPPDTTPAADSELALAHDDSGTLTAVALADGTVRWQASFPNDNGFDAAPVIGAEGIYSATRRGVVRCLDHTDGSVRWETDAVAAEIYGTPACDGTLLYLPAADGLHLLSVATGRAVRRYGTVRPIRSAPVVLGGTVFVGVTDGSVYAALPGRPLERVYETGGIGPQIVAAPAVADGALVVVSGNGVLTALEIAPGILPS